MITHVAKNQKFGIKANDWNKILDMTNSHKNSVAAKYNMPPRNMVQVVNRTGQDLPMFGVVEYDGYFRSDLSPEEKLITYLVRKPVVGNTLTSSVLQQDSHYQRICILQQPLQDLDVGNAIYTGVAKVKIKKQDDLDENKPMNVIKINNDATMMEVTNRITPDKLLWHNADFTLAVIQLNANLIFPAAFVGLLKIEPDTIANSFKIMVEDVYTKRKYHIQSDELLLDTYRNLTKIPARPRSLGVMAYYTKTVNDEDYAQIQSFFSTDMEGIVNYNDEQTTLNSMVLGKRSQKDIIGSEVYGGSYTTWYGDYEL